MPDAAGRGSRPHENARDILPSGSLAIIRLTAARLDPRPDEIAPEFLWTSCEPVPVSGSNHASHPSTGG